MMFNNLFVDRYLEGNSCLCYCGVANQECTYVCMCVLNRRKHIASLCDCQTAPERTKYSGIATLFNTTLRRVLTRAVVPAFKKWDQRVGGNHRGSRSSASLVKVRSRVLERRMRLIVRPRIREEQCRFRPGRGRLDRLHTLRRVLEGRWEFAQPARMCFVD